ncbi:MAG: hypothetical protein EOM54_05940 [Clostridia bacterium]|nr:hypothetical protein [Clostridia bacterium]NCC68846.1 hypothetical protein [Clostridia bacterium]
MDNRNQSALISGLSEADAAAVIKKIMLLLEKQAARYTTGDSSSLREETAQELLVSIRFTLDLYLRERGLPAGLLVSADMDEVFSLGIGMIEKALEEFGRLYETACLGAPDILNVSFRDTLSSIGTFRRRYDYRLFAHTIPCDVDYQLCRPVPEELLGVEYLNEYLRRIVIENDFLLRFPKVRVIKLLESYCPDYRDLLINLYDPVATNAIGLALLGRDSSTLDIPPETCADIADTLAPLSENALRGALMSAAVQLCRTLGIRDAAALDYLVQAADALCPRIDTALSAGGLSGIFLPLA